MSETKICETCKYQSELPFVIPCISCEKASKWESRQGGCDFCNGDNCECYDELYLNIEEKSVYVKIGKTTAMFTVNYCPMCGKKLVKE